MGSRIGEEERNRTTTLPLPCGVTLPRMPLPDTLTLRLACKAAASSPVTTMLPEKG